MTISSRRRKKHLAATLFLLLVASVVSADEVNNETPTTEPTLEEIAIVGSRLPAETIGVSTISLEGTLPSFTLAQVLRSVPGAAVAESGNIGSLTQMRVRGAEADHIKVLLNGNAINLVSMNLNLATISPIAVSRIDVLNGPRSTVWGHHALAGVVNLSTTATLPHNRIYIASGSQQSRNVGVDIGVNLGDIPVALHAATKTSDGINVSHQGNEKDGFEQDAVHVGYENLNERYSVSGFLRSTATKSEYDPIPRDGDRHIEADDQALGQQLSWQQADNLSIELDVGLTRSKLANFSDKQNTNEWRGDLMRVAAGSEYTLSPDHFLHASLEHAIEDFEQIGNVSAFGNPNYEATMSTTGFAVEHVVKNDRFQWHGALRREDNSDFSASTSWQGSVAYQKGAILSSYSIGVGTKNPTFIERFGYTPDQFFGNADLKPEQSLQHQIAFEHEFAEQRTTLLFYRSTLHDEINGFAYNATHNLFSAENRDRESQRRGAELRFHRSFNQVMFKANYAYNKSEEGDEPEIRRPHHLANLGLEFTVQDDLKGRANVRYVGEQLDLDFSTFPAPVVTLPDFVVCSLAIEHKLTPSVMLHAELDNLFDETYEQVYGYRTPGRMVTFGGQVTF